MMRGVCLSVCRVPRPNSRTEKCRKPKIGKHITPVTRRPVNLSRGQKVKGRLRPINAETESVSYLPKGKAYELKTWYRDGARRPISLTSAMTSKVKGQSRDVIAVSLSRELEVDHKRQN